MLVWSHDRPKGKTLREALLVKNTSNGERGK